MTPWEDRRLARRLDDDVTALLARDDLADAPAEDFRDAAVPELAPVAARLMVLEREPVEPRPDFVSELRARLLAEAERATVVEPLALPPRSRRRDRAVAAAVAGAVLVGGGATASYAAQGALPGEALYPLKRGIEQVTMVGDDDAERGRALLDQARERLDEAEVLAGQGTEESPELVRTAVQDFESAAREGGDLLVAEQRTDSASTAGDALRAFAAQSSAQLGDLARTTGSGSVAFPALVDAAAALQSLDARISRICPTCSGGPLDLPTFARASADVPVLDQVLDGPGQGVRVDRTTPLDVGRGRDPAEQAARDVPTRSPKSRPQRDRQPGGTGSTGSIGSTGGTSTTSPTAPVEGPARDVTRPLGDVVGELGKDPAPDSGTLGDTVDEVTGTVRDGAGSVLPSPSGEATAKPSTKLSDSVGGLTGGLDPYRRPGPPGRGTTGATAGQPKTERRCTSSEYSVCWIDSRTWSVTLKTSIGSSAARGS